MERIAENRLVGGVEVELLNAFIDGELDQRSRAEIEEILALNADAAGYVMQAKKLNALTRLSLESALGTPDAREIQSPLNVRLSQFRADEPVAVNNVQRAFWERPLIAVAASVILLLSGYHLGALSLEYEVERQLFARDQQKADALAALADARNRVLEYIPSGAVESWSSGDGLTQARLKPIRTLRADGNQYCREFQETVSFQGRSELLRGISCRVAKEQWQTRYILPEDDSIKM
jgi:surface antigen